MFCGNRGIALRHPFYDSVIGLIVTGTIRPSFLGGGEVFQKMGEPPVILLVDDDFDFLELVARQLEGQEEGRAFQVYVAADGTEAMAQIASLRRIDALVTDLSMPGADGLAVALSFRKQFPGKPIVMTTGSSPADERITSLLQLPQAAFLRKPFAISALVEKLCAACVVSAPDAMTT